MMTVYTWLVVLLVLAAFLFQGNQKNSKKFIVIAFLLLFIVMGLRDVSAFGSDAHGSYPITYRNTGNRQWSQIIGKGEMNYNIAFFLLMKMIYELTGGDYQSFIVIISRFVVFSYVRFIRKYSPAPFQ